MRLVFLIFILLFGITANAEEQSWSKGRMSLTDGKKVKFDSLTIEGESASYTKGDSSETIETDKILEVEVVKGSETLKWALGLGASSFIGATIGVNNAENSTGGTVSSSEKSSIVLSLTAVGAAIGAVIGSSKGTYKKVYSHPKYGSKSRFKFLTQGNDGSISFFQASFSFQ